jgi:hypothetical protein
MKMRRPAYSPTRQFYYLALLLLGAVSFGEGCQKSSASNPCEGLLNEGTPTQVGLVFVDGRTGANVLLSKDIDAATISINREPAGGAAEQGMIVKAADSPLYGSLTFTIADTKKGAYKYTINIPQAGTTTLSYTNQEVKSDNVCKPYYINVTDPTIEDRPFTISRANSRLVFTITL